MKFSDPADVASHCARAALGMMERHGVPAHPQNFAVWYTFVADRDPSLTAAINGILRSGRKFSDAINQDLYDRFFGASAESELRAVGIKIEEAVARVLGYLSTANRGAAEYGESLENLSGVLTGAPTPGGLADLIAGVLRQTREMAEVNRQLETRLQDSAGEIARLRGDLDQLKREATTDALTGLANRKLFDIALREAALEAQDQGKSLSLVMIDIDFFKLFNDTHGHQLGDQVLKLVGRALTECVKDKDTPARYGGEEFAVVLPDTRLKDAIGIAEAIRTLVSSKRVTNRRTGQVLGQVTLSAGVAEYEAGEPLGTFIHRADEALYLAKRQGRNRVMSQEDLRAGEAVEFER